jgi:hypothetical protein
MKSGPSAIDSSVVPHAVPTTKSKRQQIAATWGARRRMLRKDPWPTETFGEKWQETWL